MMFMDQSKYQQQSTASSQFYSDELTEMDSQFSQFNQYDLETSEVLRHICPVCDKTFRASSLLDIHMRVHVGAKPFVCPVCNHRATQKGNLKLHMKKHHGQDLPSHIDLVPDSGIWGSFSNNENIGETELDFYLNTKKKTALAHSSLLNENVVEIIKKCQNNIGQSTMGRITESLTDFLNIAKQRIQCDSNSPKQSLNEEQSHENINSNNNGMKNFLIKIEKSSPPLTAIAHDDRISPSTKSNLQEQPNNASQKHYCFCKICGWKTTSSGYLNVHMRKHKAESHICTICGRAFKETWYLKNHMRSHVNDIVHGREQRSVQQNSPVFQTSPPEPPFQEIDENALHEKTNKEATSSMCGKCGLIFRNRSLPVHSGMCGRPDLRMEVCKVCECPNDKVAFMENLGLSLPKQVKSNQKQSSNLKHFDALIGDYLVNLPEQNPNNVPLTSSTGPLYSLKEEIKNSIAQNGVEATKRSFHELIKNPSFKVPFSSEHLLSIAELFNVEESRAKTRYLLLNKTNTTKDKNSHYSQIKPYENPAIQSLAFIGKSLKTTDSLPLRTTVTINNATTDQHPQGYRCNYCPKRFKYRSVLGIHMRSHTGERPYKCVYCGYAGTQHNCLKLHIQRHHPEVFMSQGETVSGKEKNVEVKADIEQEHMLLSQAAKFSPARCPICDRVSPSPGYLKIHMRSHKTSLDHVCHICGRGFKEYWYLSTHLRTHENEINMPATAPENPLPAMRNQYLTKPMNTTHRNSVLTTQRSVPLAKRETSSSEHGYLRWTSSWCPLNVLEDEGTDLSSNTKLEIVKPEPVKQYVSKRKAFQPSRHCADPYSSQGSTRSRKSKPRKLRNGLYLAPMDETSSSSHLEDMNNKEANSSDSLSFPTTRKPTETEQPLDLSIAVTTPDSVCWSGNDEEEPLNLAVK